MALEIEDGTGKPNAQSYATVVELKAYAPLRGATVPTADAACEVLLVKAMDYLEAQDFIGMKATEDQALQWPRVDALVERWPIAHDEIPRQLVQAQCALAIEAQTTELMPTSAANPKGQIIRERIEGAIELEYSNHGAVRRVPAIAKADALLRTLLKRSGLVAVRS